MNQYRTLNKVFAALAFVIALITYLMTLQPSVPFWDCGEFSAAAMWQQVPHPPGAPLWLMAAKSFEAILPGDPGHNFNVFAAICSAFAAMFAYLIAVNAIERFHPFREGRPVSSYITTFGAGLIGSLAFVWSDSNWFNSVESEVYSAATLLAAVVMWLMMKWDQQAERKGNERWILLIAYVLGLSIGVHLLAMLVIPSIALTMYFRRFKKIEPISLILTLGAMGVAFLILYMSTLSWIPGIFAESWQIGLFLFAALIGLMGWAYTQKKGLVFIAAASFTLVILGYTTYTQILVRSAAHPVMNENRPDTFDELRRYLGREQYGDRPHWPRRVEYHSWHMEAMSKYGEPTPPTGRDESGNPTFDNLNTGIEIKYMFQYQIYEMYLRYLFWNFAGRTSDMQDAGVSWVGGATEAEQQALIRPTGADDIFPISFWFIPLILGLVGIFVHFRRDWKMATVFMTAFLFLGVLAALQQRQQDPQPRERDYFYAGSFMIFAIWVGFGALGAAEALGGRKEVEENEDGTLSPVGGINVNVAGAALGVCLLAAPVNMAINGWKLHDRSGNWLPWDYAYNILQSCDENAILFTNGDNDTFPLWYVQDVGGVRRDVRVVNLELAQTPWYIWQMKKEATWDAPPVPMTFPDDVIRDRGNGSNGLGWSQGDPIPVALPIPANVMSWATEGQVTTASTMTWTFKPTGNINGQVVFTPKNQIVKSIMEQTAKEGWERPVFFSVTAGNEFAGLEPYLRAQGMAYRVMPVPQTGALPVDRDIMWKCLVESVPGDEYYPELHYGFKFRGLNDPDAYFLGQDDHRRPINYFYHRLYIQFAEQLLYLENDPGAARQVLDKMIENVPLDKFGPPVQYGEAYAFMTKVATMYRDAGAEDKAKEMAQAATAELDELGSFTPRYYSLEDFPGYARGIAAAINGNYDESIRYFEELLATGRQGDPNVRLELEAARVAKALAAGDQAGAQAAFNKAIAGYGTSDGDPRLRSFTMRFPTLSLSGRALDSAQANADGTATEAPSEGE